MARPLRIEYSGAWHHVTNRGSERGEIFRDDRDRMRFLEALEESIERYGVEVHRDVLASSQLNLNVGGKPLQEMGRELGGIGGDAIAHVHERVIERMERGKRILRRMENLQTQLSQ